MDERAMLQALWDREQIREVLYRYCRGIDRADETILRSVAWPEGQDRHGAFEGTAAQFVDWAVKTLPHIERSVHQVHNVIIELHGDRATVESSFTALHRQPNARRELVVLQMCGRYLDLFEKRSGEWRIADRTVVFDWLEELPPTPGAPDARFGTQRPIGGRYPDDPLYAHLRKGRALAS